MPDIIARPARPVPSQKVPASARDCSSRVRQSAAEAAATAASAASSIRNGVSTRVSGVYLSHPPSRRPAARRRRSLTRWRISGRTWPPGDWPARASVLVSAPFPSGGCRRHPAASLVPVPIAQAWTEGAQNIWSPRPRSLQFRGAGRPWPSRAVPPPPPGATLDIAAHFGALPDARKCTMSPLAR